MFLPGWAKINWSSKVAATMLNHDTSIIRIFQQKNMLQLRAVTIFLGESKSLNVTSLSSILYCRNSEYCP